MRLQCTTTYPKLVYDYQRTRAKRRPAEIGRHVRHDVTESLPRAYLHHNASGCTAADVNVEETSLFCHLAQTTNDC